MAKKKLAIVGTSTSIMKNGYAPLLKDFLPRVTIENFSLGGAPSLYGCYVVDQEAIADEFDYAIIDFCINDQQLERNAFLSIENIVSAFGALLAKFTPKSRCRPVVLLLPQKDAFKDEKLMKVRNLALLLCQQFGIATIDIFHLLETAEREDGVDPAKFFSDWTHMHHEYSRSFARLVAKTIPSLRPPVEATVAPLLPSYRVLRPDHLPRVERRTSLMSRETFVLTRGETLDIQMSGYLAALLHWHNDDTGTLLIEANGQKLAIPGRKDKPWNNRFAFTNVERALPCDGKVVIRVGLDPAFKKVRTFGYHPRLPLDGTEIGLAGFVIANSDPTQAGGELIDLLSNEALKPRAISRAERTFINVLKSGDETPEWLSWLKELRNASARIMKRSAVQVLLGILVGQEFVGQITPP